MKLYPDTTDDLIMRVKRRKYKRKGSGLLNSAINKLPVELHIPGYNYCGPGTKLEKRLSRGDRGINELDEACKEHDIAYSKDQDLTVRHKADQILAKKAMDRVRAGKAKFGERMAALGVAGAMKAKVKLGMGVGTPKKCASAAAVKKTIKYLQNALLVLETCLDSTSTKKSEKKQQRQPRKNKSKPKIQEQFQNKYEKDLLAKIHKRKQHEQDSLEELMDVGPVAEQAVVEKPPQSRKRQLDFESFNESKKIKLDNSRLEQKENNNNSEQSRGTKRGRDDDDDDDDLQALEELNVPKQRKL